MPRREAVWTHAPEEPGSTIDHYHEWRQRWDYEPTPSGENVAFPNGYYCIHCLEVREGSDG